MVYTESFFEAMFECSQTLYKKIIYVDFKLQSIRTVNDFKMSMVSIATDLQNLSLCIVEAIEKDH